MLKVNALIAEVHFLGRNSAEFMPWISRPRIRRQKHHPQVYSPCYFRKNEGFIVGLPVSALTDGAFGVRPDRAALHFFYRGCRGTVRRKFRFRSSESRDLILVGFPLMTQLYNHDATHLIKGVQGFLDTG